MNKLVVPALVALALALVAACEATEPVRAPLSLGGHWTSTGALVMDFTAVDEPLSAGAIADSAARYMGLDAQASSPGCKLLRYRLRGTSFRSDTLIMRITCGSDTYREGAYESLPDTVKSFTVYGVGGPTTFTRQP